jgi:ribosome-associated toxin RatA of RatAB toxin-antitoxin module
LSVRSTASIWVQAPPRDVYELVADLSRWEERLPHYRHVRILDQQNGDTRAAMSARRGWIPVFWEAVQTLDPAAPAIHFHHVRGITRGMDVVWSFFPERGGTRAQVDHELSFQVPILGSWLAERVIAREFIEPIVARTLTCFRDIAEGHISHAAAAEGGHTLPRERAS